MRIRSWLQCVRSPSFDQGRFEQYLSGMALATGWWNNEKPAASALPLTEKSDTYFANDSKLSSLIAKRLP
jgi:hypothetical protein